MTQTLAIFLEAYRNLNSKKLFWFVLILSGVAVLAFACVGINEQGIKILGWQIDSPVLNTKSMDAGQFYKLMFVKIGIDFWLAWLATILALVSTAGIFPDLITSGSIDLFISKPISRLRLFLTEYLAGLLFVTLQVAVFSLACFLVMGVRGGAWEPGLFLAVPLVVCLFSYLFAVCVFLGVLTRSTVAALLLTLLFWFVIWAVGTVEQGLLMQKAFRRHRVDFSAMQIEVKDGKSDPSSAKASSMPSDPTDPDDLASKNASEESDTLDLAHRIFFDIKTVLPKTTETVSLLERTLTRVAELPENEQGEQMKRMMAAQVEVQDELQSRSITWVVGSSLGFEACVLLLGALIFCRRDY